MKQMTHFGDPCIHCGTPHDDVEIGPCKGDPAKAKILAHAVLRQAYENPGSGCETVRCFMSDGSFHDEYWRPEEWWWMHDRFKNTEVLAPHEAFKRSSIIRQREQRP